MNIAEYIVKILKLEGIDTVFGYQGGNVTYLIDAISREESIEYVQSYQEQGAAFAANAYAQVSQNFGVALSSSGPGAINLINGIANAYYDSIPCLFLTGNINTATMRESDRFRQNGFQEADIAGMVKGITKFVKTIHRPEELPRILEQALYLMREGRPGPVLLDIPHNIQRAEVKEPAVRGTYVAEEPEITEDETLESIYTKITKASRPVLLVGNGGHGEMEKKLLRTFLERFPMPAVVSLCGKDVIPNDHSCYRGMIGSYGLPCPNRVLNESDFVLALGTRMDERQRTVGIDDFLKEAEVVHVDIDKNELRHVKKDEICLHMSVKQFLTVFLKRIKENTGDLHHNWIRKTKDWMEEPIAEEAWIYDSAFKEQLTDILGDIISDSVVCVDVGNHQMAAAQVLNIGESSRYLNSAGLGSMGYALPAAVGAYYAAPDKKIVAIAGDGGFMMNLQELQLIKREKLSITIIVVNSQGLGMIENYQKLAMGGRLYGSRWGYEAADFGKIADAFGLNYWKVRDSKQYPSLKNGDPMLIEIEV
ncbi:MAG: thiamine pyrophosphate-binding protein [Eubacterium sp.]|nr:thiamine pyrophosphate-binding protein [Eubacterium sp.]